MNGLELIQEWLLEKGYPSNICCEVGRHMCYVKERNLGRFMDHKPLLCLIVGDKSVWVFYNDDGGDGGGVVCVMDYEDKMKFCGAVDVYFSDPEFFSKLGHAVFFGISDMGSKENIGDG